MSFEELKQKAGEAKTINELFKIWKQAHAVEENYTYTTVQTIEQNSFVSDGFISEDEYKNAKIKVLFVLREANIAGHRSEKDIPELRSQKDFYGKFLKDIYDDNPPKQKQKMAYK